MVGCSDLILIPVALFPRQIHVWPNSYVKFYNLELSSRYRYYSCFNISCEKSTVVMNFKQMTESYQDSYLPCMPLLFVAHDNLV